MSKKTHSVLHSTLQRLQRLVLSIDVKAGGLLLSIPQYDYTFTVLRFNMFYFNFNHDTQKVGIEHQNSVSKMKTIK